MEMVVKMIIDTNSLQYNRYNTTVLNCCSFTNSPAWKGAKEF